MWRGNRRNERSGSKGSERNRGAGRRGLEPTVLGGKRQRIKQFQRVRKKAKQKMKLTESGEKSVKTAGKEAGGENKKRYEHQGEKPKKVTLIGEKRRSEGEKRK